MPKEDRKIVESPSSQYQVCEFDRKQLSRSAFDDALQDSSCPAPVSSAFGGPAVLARSKYRQQQEPEGALHFVPLASAENEGSSTLLQEV